MKTAIKIIKQESRNMDNSKMLSQKNNETKNQSEAVERVSEILANKIKIVLNR